MNLPSIIEVVITPRDVLTTEDYTDIHNCAICKAIRRKLHKPEDFYLNAGPDEVVIDGHIYLISGEFTGGDFRDLHSRALSGERFRVKKTLTKVI